MPLINGDFTGGYTHATTFWNEDGGPYHTEFDNIVAPEGWRSWWVEDIPEPGDPDSGRVTGRPEIKLISLDKGDGKGIEHFPDPLRFLPDHTRAVQFFTNWRAHYGGLYQVVDVTPGKRYIFGAFLHAWYSQCSERPHDPPIDRDCTTPADWATMDFYVGIDPNGGENPRGFGVLWSGPLRQYGIYGPAAEISAVATGPKVTVFTASSNSHALKHNDAYTGLCYLEEEGEEDWRAQVRYYCDQINALTVQLYDISAGLYTLAGG